MTLVALDSFYIGNRKGVCKVYQLTAIDTAIGWALVMIMWGTPDAAITARDNGSEYSASAFSTAVAAKGLDHRIPPRSPNHNSARRPWPAVRQSELLGSLISRRPRRH